MTTTIYSRRVIIGLAVCAAALMVFSAQGSAQSMGAGSAAPSSGLSSSAPASSADTSSTSNDLPVVQEQREREIIQRNERTTLEATSAPNNTTVTGPAAATAPATTETDTIAAQPAGLDQAPSVFDAPATTAAPEVQAPPTPVLQTTRPEPRDGIATTTRIASSAPTAAERINNLRDAVAVGVLTSPETEAVENNRRATDEELKQAKALYMPSIDFRGDTGLEYTDDATTRAGLGDDTETLWRYDSSLTLTQMLWDGMETHYENQRQKWRVRSAAHRVRETAEFGGLNVVEAYLDVIRQRELMNLAQQNIEQHNDILRQIADSASTGRSTQADVEQTNARLASAKAQLANIQQSVGNAESTYRRRVGETPQPDLSIPGNPLNLLSTDVESEVKIAQANSPTLDIFEADVNVAEAEYEGTDSTMHPQVDLQVNGRTGDNLGGIEERDTSASALVVVNWNLFRGGGDVARERELVYRHAQAKNERANASRAVEDDVRQTWASRVAAAERAAQFQAQAEANAEVVAAYKDQFNLDRRTLLDVLDSQNEWFVSRSNAINNKYLEMFAAYRLLAIKGQLLPALEIPYPKEVNPADKS